MVELDWWTWATDWRRESKDLAHGRIEAAIMSFAVARDRAPSRIRRAVAAQIAAEQLADEGVIEKADVMAAIGLDDAEVVARLRHYGPDQARRGLQLLAEGIRGRALLSEEKKIRASTDKQRAEAPENPQARRLSTIGFRSHVLRAEEAAAKASGRHLVRAKLDALVPLPIDAISLSEDGKFRALRLVATLVGTDATRRRQATVAYALATARFIDLVDVVCEAREDAVAMVRDLAWLPPCGVAIGWLDRETDRVEVLHVGNRDVPPDLAEPVRQRLASAVKA